MYYCRFFVPQGENMYTKAQPFAEFGVFEMTKKAFKSRNVVTLPYSTTMSRHRSRKLAMTFETQFWNIPVLQRSKSRKLLNFEKGWCTFSNDVLSPRSTVWDFLLFFSYFDCCDFCEKLLKILLNNDFKYLNIDFARYLKRKTADKLFVNKV